MLRYLGHPYQLLGIVLAVFVGLIGHNLVQAWVANLLGDREPRRAGFLSLDLRKHVDPLGAVACIVVYFGWGFPAPVPIESRFRRQRTRATVALLAGPAFLLVLLFAVTAIAVRVTNPHLLDVASYAAACLSGLTVLSILPIPPLSGGRAFFLYAPTSPGWQRARFQLSETHTGRFIALGIVLLPILFPLLPDVVRELADPLLRWVIRTVGSSPNPL